MQQVCNSSDYEKCTSDAKQLLFWVLRCTIPHNARQCFLNSNTLTSFKFRETQPISRRPTAFTTHFQFWIGLIWALGEGFENQRPPIVQWQCAMPHVRRAPWWLGLHARPIKPHKCQFSYLRYLMRFQLKQFYFVMPQTGFEQRPKHMWVWISEPLDRLGWVNQGWVGAKQLLLFSYSCKSLFWEMRKLSTGTYGGAQ